MPSATPCPSTPTRIVIGAGTGGAAFTGVPGPRQRRDGPAARGRPRLRLLRRRRLAGRHARRAGHPAVARLGTSDTGRTRAGSGPPTGPDRRRLLRAQRLHGLGQRPRTTTTTGPRRATPAGAPAEVEPLLEWVRQQFRVRRYRTRRAHAGPGRVRGCRDSQPGYRSPTTSTPSRRPWGSVRCRSTSSTACAGTLRSRSSTRCGRPAEPDDRRRRPRAPRSSSTARRRDRRAWSTRRTDRARDPAGRVVVAAGAYHSPALLLRSGIGPARRRSRDSGSTSSSTCPVSGGTCSTTPASQLDFAGTPGLLAELAATASGTPTSSPSGRARSTRCDDGPYDIHVFMVAGANSGHPGPAADLPVRRRDARPLRGCRHARPRPDSRAPSSTTATAPTLTGTTGRCWPRRSTCCSDGRAARARRDPRRASRRADADPLDDIVNYCHPAGTCKMGPADDRAGRGRRRGRVHGIHGPLRRRRLDHAGDHPRQHQPADRHDRREYRAPDAARRPAARITSVHGAALAAASVDGIEVAR